MMINGSAIFPEHGYPRVFRYVDTMKMPSIDTLTTLDRAQNVLVINKTLFDCLGDLDRIRVLRTHASQLNVKPSRDYVEVIWPKGE